MKYLMNAQYYSTFKALIRRSSAARKHFRRAMSKQIAKELRQYAKSSDQMGVPAEDMDTFDWTGFLAKVQTSLPFLYDAVSAVIRMNRYDHDDLAEKDSRNLKIIGSVLGQLLYLHKPKRYSNLQKFNSIQIWHFGGTQKVLEYLQHLGVTLGVRGTRAALDKVVERHDPEMLAAKEQQGKVSAPGEEIVVSCNTQHTSNAVVSDGVPRRKKGKHDTCDRPVCADLPQKKRCPPLEDGVTAGADESDNDDLVNSSSDSLSENEESGDSGSLDDSDSDCDAMDMMEVPTAESTGLRIESCVSTSTVPGAVQETARPARVKRRKKNCECCE